MKKCPTFEEFKEQVETMFMEHWSSLSKEEAMAYLYEDDYIKHCYDEEKSRYLSGESTLEQFIEGATARIAYQYIMEY